MKIQMSIHDLKDIFKACKHAMSKDDYKPILTTIQLNCVDGRCKATSLDGHRIRFVEVTCTGDTGTLYIPIVSIPKSKVNYDVTIEDTEKEISFEFLTEKQVVRKVDGEFPNTDRVVPNEEPVFTINFNPKYMKEAFESFEDKAVTVQFFGETKPCIIKSKSENYSLILPLQPK